MRSYRPVWSDDLAGVAEAECRAGCRARGGSGAQRAPLDDRRPSSIPSVRRIDGPAPSSPRSFPVPIPTASAVWARVQERAQPPLTLVGRRIGRCRPPCVDHKSAPLACRARCLDPFRLPRLPCAPRRPVLNAIRGDGDYGDCRYDGAEPLWRHPRFGGAVRTALRRPFRPGTPSREPMACRLPPDQAEVRTDWRNRAPAAGG